MGDSTSHEHVAPFEDEDDDEYENEKTVLRATDTTDD